jgi:phosphoglycerate dehydrogenase-like enzyme
MPCAAATLGGAATDVLSVEPPVNGNPLLAGDIPRLIVTPHNAWGSREARQRSSANSRKTPRRSSAAATRRQLINCATFFRSSYGSAQ